VPSYLASFSLLIAFAFVLGTKFAGLIESINSNYLLTSSSGYDSLPAAEDMSHNDYQKRTLFTVNAISSMSKEHTAVFYESPLRVENNSCLFIRSPSSEESGVNAKSFIFTI